MRLTSAKVTGNPDGSSWAQIHDFTPQEPEKVSARGRLIAVMATESKEGGATVDVITTGREILTRLHEEYYGNTTANPLNALKEAVSKVAKEFEGEFGKVEIGAVAIVENICYLATKGVGVGLLRKGMMAKILESGKASAVAASGKAEDGDTLALGTDLFFETIGSGVIKAALEASSVDGAVEILSPVLHSKEKLGSLGAAIIRFGEESFPTQKLVTKISRTPQFNLFLAGVLEKILKLIPERRIVIKQDMAEFEFEKKRKTAVVVGIILILLLGVSIFFGLRQKGLKLSRSKYESRLEEAQHQVAEAQSLATLNPARARELILSAKTTAETLRSEGVKDSELDLLIRDIADQIGKVAGIYEIEAEIFQDLALLTSGFKGDDLAFSDGRMIVLDRAGERLVQVVIETKKTKVIAGPEILSDPKYITAYAPDRNFVLDNDGVREIKDKAELVIESEWSSDTWLQAYTGNMYVLDKEASKIYRYAGTGTGFGSKQDWFGEAVDPDLSDSISWAIDGSVWILKDVGRILKFTHGSPDPFSLTGVDKDLTGAKAIFADDATKYLYILDPQNSRMVVVDKEGIFKAEYITGKAKEATDLVVSEEDKKAILLIGDKLYSIELAHLD